MPQTIRADVSRTVQYGAQSLFDVAGTVNRRFPTLQFERGTPERPMRPVRPSTFKVPTTQHGGKEQTRWTAMSDGVTADEVALVMETCIKTVTPVTVAGAVSQDRTITPGVSSQDTRKFLTVEEGQPGDLWTAKNAFFEGFKLTSSDAGIDFSADLVGADMAIPAALSGSATTLSLKQILKERVGVMTASTFANLAAKVYVFTLTLGTQTASNFQLWYGGQSTGNLAGGPGVAATMQTALNALTSIVSGATVVLVSGTTFTITLTNPATLGQTLIADFSTLATPANASLNTNYGPLDNCLQAELDFSKLVSVFHRLKQGERSYGGTVEIPPTLNVNLTCAVDQVAQELSGAGFTLADWRAGTVRFFRWQWLTTELIQDTTPAKAWELTFDMALSVGAPYTRGQVEGLSVVTWPCQVNADSLGNWFSIKSVSTLPAL